MTLYIVYIHVHVCKLAARQRIHFVTMYMYLSINYSAKKGEIIIKAMAMKQQKIKIKPNDWELINAIK